MKYLITLAMAFIMSNAQAGFMATGQDLIKGLSSEASRELAIGYVLGTLDTRERIDYCTPKEFDPQAAVEYTEMNLKNNPDKLDQRASIFVTTGLKEMFPCKTKEKSL